MAIVSRKPGQPGNLRLLVSHFTRRFLENDLVPQGGDRHEALTVFVAAAASIGVFLSFLLSLKYLMMPFALPSWVAVRSLSDRMLLIALPMAVMALMATVQWQAVGLDARDISILGSLPVTRRTLVTAKFAASLVFASLAAFLMAAVPGVVFPVLMLAPLGIVGIGLRAGILVAAAQTATITLAGLLGWMAIACFKEVVRALAGEERFARYSTSLQGATLLILLLTTMAIPALASQVGMRWASGGLPTLWIPPFWFLAAYEVLTFGVLRNVTMPALPERAALLDRQAAEVYATIQPAFPQHAMVGLIVLLAVVAIWMVSAGRTGARAQALNSSSRRLGGWTAVIRRAADRFMSPPAQAGFMLTTATLGRNGPHRSTLLVAIASCLALTAVLNGSRNWVPSGDVGTTPLSVLALQPALLTVLLLAFRRASSMPADHLGSRAVLLAWSGTTRDFQAGVRWAGLLMLCVPVALLGIPLTWSVLGPRLAVVHALVGVLVGAALFAVTVRPSAGLPFVVGTRTPAGLGFVAPILGVCALGVVTAFAWLERLALEDGIRTAGLILSLLSVCIVATASGRANARVSPPSEDDSDSESSTQQLGLSE